MACADTDPAAKGLKNKGLKSSWQSRHWAISASAPRIWTTGATYGSSFLGLQRVDKSRSTLAFRMDDRKQRLFVDADGGAGHRLLRLGGCRCGCARCARGAARTGRHRGRARHARARRRAACERPDRAQRSGRQSARSFSTAPRPRPSRSSPAATSPASAPGRSAWATS